MKLFILAVLLFACGVSAQTVPSSEATNAVPVTFGTITQAQTDFLTGLEWGSGIAALVFGFITVRRALGIGDSRIG